MALFGFLEKVFPRMVYQVTPYVKYHRLGQYFSLPSTKTDYDKGILTQYIETDYSGELLKHLFDTLKIEDFIEVLRFCETNKFLKQEVLKCSERDLKNLMVSTFVRKEPAKLYEIFKWQFNFESFLDPKNKLKEFLETMIVYFQHENFEGYFNPAQKLCAFIHQVLPQMVKENLPHAQLSFIIMYLNVEYLRMLGPQRLVHEEPIDLQEEIQLHKSIFTDNTSRVIFSVNEFLESLHDTLGQSKELHDYFMDSENLKHTLSQLNNYHAINAVLKYMVDNTAEKDYPQLENFIMWSMYERKITGLLNEESNKIINYLHMSQLPKSDKKAKKIKV